MDDEFLSIKQAAERYVVSDVTLRRLAREITRDEHHEYREYVRPPAADLRTLKQENKPFEYELCTKLLGLRYKQVQDESEEGTAKVNDKREDVGTAAMNLLQSTNDLLHGQLQVKDDQIRQLNESLRAMQQQQNATNMLLVRLSERIPLLAEGASQMATGQTDGPGPSERGRAKTKTATKAAPSRVAKSDRSGGLLRWLRWGKVAKPE